MSFRCNTEALNDLIWNKEKHAWDKRAIERLAEVPELVYGLIDWPNQRPKG